MGVVVLPGSARAEGAFPPIVRVAPEPATLSAGLDHTCAVRPDRTVLCWGTNLSGGVGDGTYAARSTPTPVVGLAGVREVAAGDEHTCALTVDGRVFCWGDNRNFQIGTGRTNPPLTVALPRAVSTGGRVSSISAGKNFTCALIVDGTVQCWGDNTLGSLGRLTPGQVTGDVAAPVTNLSDVIAVSAGGYHACALLSTGLVRCWGFNGDLQLGDTRSSGPTHAVVGGVSGAVAVDAGGRHTCVLLADRSAACWGANDLGQLGDGTLVRSSAPKLVAVGGELLRPIASITAGGAHTCVAMAGVVLAPRCWGDNGTGALGLGAIGVGVVVPVEVKLPVQTAMETVVAGPHHTCALRTFVATVHCWGDNSLLSLGIGAAPQTQPTPTALSLTALRPADLVPLEPMRVHDSRPGSTTVDPIHVGEGPHRGLFSVDLAFLPADRFARAVVVTVTAVNPAAAGFVGLAPSCDPDLFPATSILNFGQGQTIANTVTVPKDPSILRVCFVSSAVTDLIVDVAGFYPADLNATSTFTPARLLDTRPDGSTVDGVAARDGLRSAGSVTQVIVDGRGGVGPGVAGVSLSITAVDARGAGFLTVWPCGAPQPNASTLNFRAGQTIANAIATQVGVNGAVCVFTSASTHLLVDVTAFRNTASNAVSLVPARFLDTRSGGSTIDGQFVGAGRLTAGSTTELRVAGRSGVATSARAVALNVTVTDPSGTGFLTVWPCGSPRPNASSINFAAGDTVANNVLMAPGRGGAICIFTPTATHAIVDVTGYE